MVCVSSKFLPSSGAPGVGSGATALTWLAWFRAFQSSSGRNQDFFTHATARANLSNDISSQLLARLRLGELDGAVVLLPKECALTPDLAGVTIAQEEMQPVQARTLLFVVQPITLQKCVLNSCETSKSCVPSLCFGVSIPTRWT